jgi:glutamate 5-kinase
MRIVVKVGTSTLAHPTGQLNIRHMEELCKVLSDIKNAGDEVILVSSGAIGMGMGKLHLRERPKSLPEKQAAAACTGSCSQDTGCPRISRNPRPVTAARKAATTGSIKG